MTATNEGPRPSRRRYRLFVQDYKHGRLDDASENDPALRPGSAQAALKPDDARRGKRRQYLREYLRWLWPYRYAVAAVFFFALLAGGLEMVEPLFMRFIVDKVLLNGSLDTAARMRRLQLAGAAFPSVIVLASLRPGT